MTAHVPAADVRGNDWRSLPVSPPDQFEPQRRVTVVITYYEAPDALELTLAALEIQTYPRELFEVVIVDDGSRLPLTEPEHSPLDVRVVHQEDLGFGLARARNTGVRAASNDIIVFLDCDMVPESGWLAEHARWHHAASDVLTLGFRAHVDVTGIDAASVRDRPGSLADLFAGRAVDRPEWIEFHMVRTGELTSDADDLFRVVTGGNLGVSRSFFELVGGYDETFTQWGCEDTEFGYRAFTRGAVLVPARDAMCWHQGPGAAPSSAETASLEMQRAKISQLIAHYGFRRAVPGRSFTVPQYVVTVEPGEADPEALLATVEHVLASKIHDLVVWINETAERRSDSDPVYEKFRRLVAGDPRVRIGPVGGAADALPAAQFHVTMSASSKLRDDDLARLTRSLGTAPATRMNLADGSEITLTRARFVHRAARTGRPLEQAGAFQLTDPTLSSTVESPSGPVRSRRERTLRPTRVARDTTPTPAPAVTARPRAASIPRAARPSADERIRKIGDMFRLMSRQALRVRSLEDATKLVRAFAEWFGAAIAWRLRWVAWKHRQGARWVMWRTRRAHSWTRRATRKTMWKTLRAHSWTRRTTRKTMWKALRARSWTRRATRKTMWKALRARSWTRRTTRKTIWGARRSRSALRTLGQSRLNVGPAAYRLGPRIATLDPEAEAVLEASNRIDLEVGPSTQVVLTSGTVEGPALISGAEIRSVTLTELDPSASVPAFDAEQVNPMNSTFECRKATVSLGPIEALPADTQIRKTIKPGKIIAARRFHHVVDTAEFHESTTRRAATLTAHAAAGAVVHIVDGDPELRSMLGSTLYDLMADPASTSASEHHREAISVAMRREALRTHSLRARARQILEPTGFEGPPLPLVSILLATRRPAQLQDAIGAVTRQAYPRIELVLALHGDGFDKRDVERLRAGIEHPNRVVYVPREAPLGAVLNAAVAESTGTLLTKFDDDDFYGPEHIWDLVLAHEYSRACLVGKAAEYVYLQHSDRTIHRFRGGGERLGTELSLAGGAMMISRNDLDAILGWQDIPSGVDQALIKDVTGSGRRLYRTHGKGYILVRHGDTHTWAVDDGYFMDQAQEVRDGCDLAFAGIFDTEINTQTPSD